MSLALPLAVRLKTASVDRHVTRDLRDLQFRSVAPGGFASATFSLDRPLDLQPIDIDYYGELYVYDRRNGATVWEGRLEDPGRSAADGEIWQVTAVGPSAHAQDRTVPLIYVDQSLSDGWVRQSAQGLTRIQVGVSGDPVLGDSTQAIVITFQEGASELVGDRGVWRYQRIDDAGQNLARVDYSWDAAVTSTNFQIEAIAGGTTFRSENWNTAGVTSSPKVVVTDWAVGESNLYLWCNLSVAGAANYAQPRWCSIRNVFVLAMRKNASGADITTGYATNSVLASEVVADLLGRLLPKFDGANASIAATSFPIDSLAYPEGVTPDTVLSDLMLLEPAFFWAAWESNSAGLYRFEWSPWPTTVRYEATVYDGFDSPGSAVDLYNAVRVRYIDINGRLRTLQRTQTAAALTAAGLTREGLLDLTTSQGRTSKATAQRAGDQWLAQRAVPPNAGTLTVARRIRDLVTGALVHPWEIRPGNLIRVRGVLPRVDALNPSDRDGVTVFRISASTFQASSASASLELDSYPLTVAHALAKLGRRR